MNAFNLTGKVALITGGGSGLGLGIAKIFIGAGARVIIVGQNLDKLQHAAQSLGEQCCYRQLDITQLMEIPAFVDELDQQYSSIDILVNCAGKHLKKAAIETTDSEYLEILNIHLLSTFALTREVAKKMLPRKNGSIILISSMSAIMSMDRVVAYSTAKTAVLGLMRGMLAELAPSGVRINTIAPGWIDTPMLHVAIDNDPERKQKILSRIPIKEFGMPEDIGYTALFLASDVSKYINGVLLPVDGGAAVGF